MKMQTFLKVIAWLLLPLFFLLILLAILGGWALWLVEFPLLLVSLQILKAYPMVRLKRDSPNKPKS